MFHRAMHGQRKKLISADQAAKILGCSRTTFWREEQRAGFQRISAPYDEKKKRSVDPSCGCTTMLRSALMQNSAEPSLEKLSFEKLRHRKKADDWKHIGCSAMVAPSTMSHFERNSTPKKSTSYISYMLDRQTSSRFRETSFLRWKPFDLTFGKIPQDLSKRSGAWSGSFERSPERRPPSM